MRSKTSAPPPGPGPHLVKREDPSMLLIFSLGMLACFAIFIFMMLFFTGYRILSGYLISLLN